MTGAVTRRAVSAGALLPLATGTPALAGDGTRVDALWRQWKVAAAEQQRADAEYAKASARLPWWAAPGPAYVDGDGRPILEPGRCSGSPAIQDFTPKPEHAGSNVMHLIRPSRYDLKRSFDMESRLFGRARASATFKRRMRGLVQRLRAQRKEEQLAGIPAAEAEIDRCDRLSNGVDDALRELPPSLDKLAVLVLIDIRHEGDWDKPAWGQNTTGSMCEVVLPGLLPFLTGEVAADVGRFLAAEKTRPLKETFLWTGVVSRSVDDGDTRSKRLISAGTVPSLS